ncbi:MAG: hypothetical protein K2L50_07905 [Bacteroidales bacterium]|nr:hypothetical protein [Bacteroidales bacterium]
MRRVLRIALVAALFAAFLAVVVLMLRYAANERQEGVCNRTDIRIERDGIPYLQAWDIENWLSRYGIAIERQLAGHIDAAHIERVLLQNPYVASAQVYLTEDGVCTMRIRQRDPALKVIGRGAMYQLDREGVEMPVNTDYPAHLRVAGGHIPFAARYGLNVRELSDTSPMVVLKHLFHINRFLEEDAFWNALFEQIYVTSDMEYELIPKVGGQLIKLGKIENEGELAEKMCRLKLFYLKGMGQEGWKKYSVLNLKYKNQVVATKRQNF